MSGIVIFVNFYRFVCRKMAVSVGFEPTEHISAFDGLANR